MAEDASMEWEMEEEKRASRGPSLSLQTSTAAFFWHVASR